MEEDDDFHYVPLKKIKRKSQDNKQEGKTNRNSIKTKQVTKTKNSEAKVQKNTCARQRKKTPSKKTPIRERKKYDGHCPNCQMPFAILVIESPSWHASECVDSFNPKSECSEGADCDCTIQNHYYKFSHRQLAESRASKARRDKIEKARKGKTQLDFENEVFSDTVSCPASTSNVNSTNTSVKDTTPTQSQQLDNVLDLESIPSPQDISDYFQQVEEAFKEATFGSQKGLVVNVENLSETIVKTHDEVKEINESDISDSVGGEKINSGSDSHDSHLLGDESFFSEKSVSDIDACGDSNSAPQYNTVSKQSYQDEDSNSNQSCQSNSFFKSYKQKIGILDIETNKSNISCQNLEQNVMKRKLNEDPIISEKQSSGKGKDEENFETVDDDVLFVSMSSSQTDNGQSSQRSVKSTSLSSQRSVKYTSLSSQRSVKSTSLSSQGMSLNPKQNKSLTKTINLKNKSKKKKEASDSGKQPTLFTFFSGNQKCSNKIKNSDQTINDDCVKAVNHDMKKQTSVIISKENLKVSVSITNPKKDDAKLKNENDLDDSNIKTKGHNIQFGNVVQSLKKSSSAPSDIDTNKICASSSNVKNASEILMRSQSFTVKKCTEASQNIGKTKTELTLSNSVSDSDSSVKPTRSCPFYKKIPDTGFTVDAFCYGTVPGCTAYFLSHFHYDHYRGLSKKFSQPIYCSKITGNLIRSRIGVQYDVIHDLPMDAPCTVNGVEVTLLEANHCPGSVLFLFKTSQGKLILHTGDFRANISMEEIPCLKNMQIHQLYLDTTYCDPGYDFPPQKLVIDFAVSLVQKVLSAKPNTLVVCGSYTIGKERIFTAIAKTFDCKICVQRDKLRILECLEDNDLRKKLSLDFNSSFLHVLPMGKLNIEDLDKHVSSLKRKFDHVIAIEPTGWTYNNKMVSLEQIKPKGNQKIQIYGLPYSEHSSYLELKRFVQFLRPLKILPTVNNGNPASRRKMENIFTSWMNEDNNDKPRLQTSLNKWTI